jgi:hypothetical protein
MRYLILLLVLLVLGCGEKKKPEPESQISEEEREARDERIHKAIMHDLQQKSLEKWKKKLQKAKKYELGQIIKGKKWNTVLKEVVHKDPGGWEIYLLFEFTNNSDTKIETVYGFTPIVEDQFDNRYHITTGSDWNRLVYPGETLKVEIHMQRIIPRDDLILTVLVEKSSNFEDDLLLFTVPASKFTKK